MRIHRIPKAEQVADRLRAEVAVASPGQRLPTEAALAKRYGVSVNTLREGLSQLVREGRIDRRHGCGTFVTTSAARRHVALWFGLETSYPLSNATQRLLCLLQDELFQRGVPAKAYLVTGVQREFSGDLVCEEFVRDVESGRVSALGVVTGRLAPSAWKAVRYLSVPMVGPSSADTPPTVATGVDWKRLTQRAVNRLRSLGCRRVACLTWLDERSSSQSRSQLTLFQDALTAAGLAFEPRWVAGNMHPTLPGAGYELFREIWSARAEKPDGLFVGDDVLLPDLVSAVLELRVAVPEQLKVVITANRGVTPCPHFPTDRLDVDLADHARITADLLARLSRREPVAEHAVELPVALVESEAVTQTARQALAAATPTQ